MAEQFDMDIYNNALDNGYYTEPKNVTTPINASNIVYVGDSGSNLNLEYLSESNHSRNVEYKQFSNNTDK
ncbi:MAG: hypothetical protein IK102_10235 [Treponema sp.]|nr:hypothetical protein [Treponema sp.]